MTSQDCCASFGVAAVVQVRQPPKMPVSIEKNDSKLKAWCQKELSKLLGFPVEEELVR